MPKDPIGEQYAELLKAIERKQPLKVIQRIVQANPELVRKKNAEGWLALHHAARHGSPLEVIRYLVDEYPEALERKTSCGWLPLHFAAENAPVGVVRYLAGRKGQALKKETNQGFLPLHVAARSSPPEVVEVLVRAWAGALQQQDNSGHLPVHIAAQYAKLPTVKILTEGWDQALQEKTHEDWLPLHYAARQGRLDVVQYLVTKRREALPGRTSNGWTPLHVAAEFGSLEVVEYLAEERPRALGERTDEDLLPLHVAARSAPLPVVRCVAEKYPRALLARSKDGSLPLHVAAMCASLPIVRYLGEAQPQALKKKTQRGQCPLHVAARYAQIDVVEWLGGQYGPAVREADGDGALPLHIAAQYAPVGVVDFLTLRHRKALEEATKDGSLPLHKAALQAPAAVVKYLMQQSRQALQAEDHEGLVPLHVAARQGPLVVVQCLASGWRPALRAVTHDGERPVDVARRFTNMDVFEWLERDGQDDSSISSSSNSAFASELQEADRERLREVVENVSRKPALISVGYVESIRTATILGWGVFGTVFKGRDSKLGQEFAIKSLRKDLLQWGSRDDLHAAEKMFKTEQEALSHFRHPNIAAMFGYTDLIEDEPEGRFYKYLLYELAEKGSLAAFLKDDLGRSRLGTFQRRLQISIDVLTAIRFLHEGSKDKQIKSCVHRDIKSANIVIKRDFTAQLIDCGLAKFVDDDSGDITTAVKGTNGYTCPEYSRTCRYTAASDIYSFGVVMLELWTGRLQNSMDESGAKVHFGRGFIDQKQSVNERVDRFMDVECSLFAFASQYATLAVGSISENCQDRPSGDTLLIGLKDIFERCSPKQLNEQENVAGGTSISALRTTGICLNCRTIQTANSHDLCALCLGLKELREMVASLSKQVEGSTSTVSQQIEDSRTVVCRQIEGAGQEMRSANMQMIRALAHLDRRLNNPVPRMFVIVPADKKSFKQNPRSWFLDFVVRKFSLYFVCSVTHQAVSSPVKLKVPKEWIRQAAPVLAVSLVMIKIAIAVTPIPVEVPEIEDAVNNLLEITSENIELMMDGLSSFLTESDRELVERVRTKTLSASDIEVLNGAAYELVVEKALDPNERGWRLEMEPVRVPPSAQVFWVSKTEAEDPKYEVIK